MDIAKEAFNRNMGGGRWEWANLESDLSEASFNVDRNACAIQWVLGYECMVDRHLGNMLNFRAVTKEQTKLSW